MDPDAVWPEPSEKLPVHLRLYQATARRAESSDVRGCVNGRAESSVRGCITGPAEPLAPHASGNISIPS
jgi:hypothetical protein